MGGLAVVNGAAIACTFGATPSVLKASGTGGVRIMGQALATINDNTPAHLGTFGMCKVDQKPCTPVTPAPWANGGAGIETDAPVLAADAKLSCVRCGTITITSPGQAFVTAELAGAGAALAGLAAAAKEDWGYWEGMREPLVEWLQRIQGDGVTSLISMLSTRAGGAYWSFDESKKLTDPDCQGAEYFDHLAKCLPGKPPIDGPPGPPRPPRDPGAEPVGLLDLDNPITALVTLPVSGVVKGAQVGVRGGGWVARGIGAGGKKALGGLRDGARGAIGLGDDALGLVGL